MKPNPNLDELLCSFMDGELSPRQRTEVQRMANRDPQVAQRLRQLQNCRTLLGALPQAQAPADLLDQVRGALERRTLLAEEPVFARRSSGSWHLAFRKLVTAAAMIALLGVLGGVVYQIVAPVPDTGRLRVANVDGPPKIESGWTAPPALTVADAGFSGRLELQTATLTQADTLLKMAIKESGLSGHVEQEEIDTAGGKRVYRLVSTREGINRVVASLGNIWQNFQSATLRVDRPGNDITPVVIRAVTPEQALGIISRASTEASVAAAEDYAVMNDMAQRAPGRPVLAAIDENAGSGLSLLTVPNPPIEASNDKNAQITLAPPEGQVGASLTIVLLDTR